MKILKGIDNKLDEAWSKKVKEVAGNKCEYCGKTAMLNSHHIFSRSNKSVRWDVENGVCLCVGHHTFSSVFSAHKTPLEFIEWLKSHRGEQRLNELRIKANTSRHWLKFEKEELLKELQ